MGSVVPTGPQGGTPDGRGWAQNGGAVAGFNGNFYRAMFGPKYIINSNVYLRTALACDLYDGTKDSKSNQPFDAGTQRHQELLVFDVVVTY